MEPTEKERMFIEDHWIGQDAKEFSVEVFERLIADSGSEYVVGLVFTRRDGDRFRVTFPWESPFVQLILSGNLKETLISLRQKHDVDGFT